jgi:hypothetical protein
MGFRMAIKDSLDWIVLIGAAVGSILLISRQFYKLFKTWFKFIDDWAGSQDKPGIMERLDYIQAELMPNHGTSVKDKINKLEANQQVILDHLFKKDLT